MDKEIKIIVTHLHNDHAGSLSQLILYSYFVKNKKITVLSKCEKIKEYLDITGTPEDAYELKNDIEWNFKEKEGTPTLKLMGEIENVNGEKIILKEGKEKIKLRSISEFEIINTKQKGTEIFLMHLDDKEYIRKATNNEFNM